MTKVLYGKVRGKTIELDADPGLNEGQAVEVTVRTPADMRDSKPGDGFLRTEGALADDTNWDAIMAEIHADRKRERRPAPELP